MRDKRKILVSAYGCEPGKGSEAGVGWNWVREMAKHGNELWVITRANNKNSIEMELRGKPAADPLHFVHFVYYDLPRWASFWKKKEKGLYFYYILWQIGAFLKAKQLCGVVRFDYALHLTFGNMWLPTFLPFLPVPFLWGPVGGGEAVPWTFAKRFPFGGLISEFLRRLLIKSARFNPFFLACLFRANLVLVRTKESRDVIPKKYSEKVKMILETGFDIPEEKLSFHETGRLLENRHPTLLFVGRLIPSKGLDVAIKAFCEVCKDCPRARFAIIGEGPQESEIRYLIEALGLRGRVSFLGKLPREQVLQHMQRADVFVYPSLKEAGAWVLLEAMASRLPIVAFRLSGMSEILDDECAILLKAKTPEAAVADFAEALKILLANPEKRRRMGANARKRVEAKFRWENKGVFFEECLREQDTGAKQ